MSSFRFSVCPHDTAKNIVGWFLLNTYLQRRLNCAIKFEPQDNFIQERNSVLRGDYHIVYANPMSAAIFRKKLGFIPVARPSGVFDNTVLVGNAHAPKQHPVKIASATDKLIVHQLGLSLLKQQHIPPDNCEFQFVGTHLAAVKTLLNGNADLAFVYNETWDGLTETTRQGLRVIAQTDNQNVYHCFCVCPQWADKAEKLREILCSMQNTPEGKRILNDLHFMGFEPASIDDIEQISLMFEIPEAG